MGYQAQQALHRKLVFRGRDQHLGRLLASKIGPSVQVSNKTITSRHFQDKPGVINLARRTSLYVELRDHGLPAYQSVNAS